MKITTISDTHNFEPVLPGGDLLIHAGDLSKYGFRSEVVKQLNYLHEQLDKYKNVIFTAGNHDLFAERHMNEMREAAMLGGLIFLCNESYTLDGLNFWASPNTKRYHDWAFNNNTSELYDLWQTIPNNTHILITHSPPFNILDVTHGGEHIGCPELARRISEVKPKFSIFGHCHESPGVFQTPETTFVNAAKSVFNFELIHGIITLK